MQLTTGDISYHLNFQSGYDLYWRGNAHWSIRANIIIWHDVTANKIIYFSFWTASYALNFTVWDIFLNNRVYSYACNKRTSGRGTRRKLPHPKELMELRPAKWRWCATTFSRRYVIKSVFHSSKLEIFINKCYDNWSDTYFVFTHQRCCMCA